MLTEKDITYLQNSAKRMKIVTSVKYPFMIFLLINFVMGLLHLFAFYKGVSASAMSFSEVVGTLSSPDSEVQYSAVHLFLAKNLMMALSLIFGLCPLLSVILLLAITSAKRDYRIYQLLQSRGLIEQRDEPEPV